MPRAVMLLSNILLKQEEAPRLLEHLAVGPFVGLAVDGDWLVPGPLVVDKLTVLWLGWVKLGDGVAVEVGGDIESRDGVLATDDEGALDDAVVGNAVDGGGAEDVLAAGLETSEETANEVGGHEGHGELVVVLVVQLPDGVFVEFGVLPEPGKSSLAGLLVGVLALPATIVSVRNVSRAFV